MKIIHTADLHLDSKMDSFSLEFAKERRNEILFSFERLVEFANMNGVRVVIIAGDIFDSDKIYEKTKNYLKSIFNKYPKIDFLYLLGNHDRVDVNSNPFVDCVNVKEFGSEFINYNYDNVNICGTNGLLGINYDELNLPENQFNIAVFHGQIVDYNTREKGVISLPQLKNKNMDYIAMGHLHSFIEKRVDNRCVACYSGCLEGRGYDEMGKKGFVLIDTESINSKYTFIPFSIREVVVKEFIYKGEDYSKFTSDIVDDINLSIKSSDILKVVLKGGSNDPYGIDVEWLKNKLKSYVKHVVVENKIKFINDDLTVLSGKTLRGEFVSLVEESDLENLTKMDVIMCGIKALSGEEI